MSQNLSGLIAATTTATALSNLILVSPQQTKGYRPQSASGSSAQQPPALLFHYEGEQTVTIESDITDHYVEQNYAIQDQIALRPEIITTHGFIGELNDLKFGGLSFINEITSKLTAVSAFAPGFSASATNAINQAQSVYSAADSVVNSAVSAWSSITGGGGENVIDSTGLTNNVFNPNTGTISNNQSKQQVMFQQFYGYWRARTLFTVQTPWAIFQNMAIKTLRAIQDADTRMITDFEVSFKMIRLASTVGEIDPLSVFQGRRLQQSAEAVNYGTQTNSTSSVSQADSYASMQAVG